MALTTSQATPEAGEGRHVFTCTAVPMGWRSKPRRLVFPRCHRYRRLTRLVLAVDRLRFVHLHVGGRHRSRRTMLVGVAIGIHYPKVVLGMLVQVFGRDTITARCGFACQGYVPLKNLIRISANFDIGAIAVESLDSMRHPRPIVMRIIAIIATARSLVWTWSHDTYLVTVDTVGFQSDRSVRRPLNDLQQGVPRYPLRAPAQRQSRLAATVDATVAYSKVFLTAFGDSGFNLGAGALRGSVDGPQDLARLLR